MPHRRKLEIFATEQVAVAEIEGDQVDAGDQQKEERDQAHQQHDDEESQRHADGLQCGQLLAGRIGRIMLALDHRGDVVEIEARDQRGDRRDEEDRADHERQPAEPLNRFLDPVGPLHEIAESPLDADDEKGEKTDGEGHAFEQHGAEGRREQIAEGLTCGAEHDVFLSGEGI